MVDVTLVSVLLVVVRVVDEGDAVVVLRVVVLVSVPVVVLAVVLVSVPVVVETVVDVSVFVVLVSVHISSVLLAMLLQRTVLNGAVASLSGAIKASPSVPTLAVSLADTLETPPASKFGAWSLMSADDTCKMKSDALGVSNGSPSPALLSSRSMSAAVTPAVPSVAKNLDPLPSTTECVSCLFSPSK